MQFLDNLFGVTVNPRTLLMNPWPCTRNPHLAMRRKVARQVTANCRPRWMPARLNIIAVLGMISSKFCRVPWDFNGFQMFFIMKQWFSGMSSLYPSSGHDEKCCSMQFALAVPAFPYHPEWIEVPRNCPLLPLFVNPKAQEYGKPKTTPTCHMDPFGKGIRAHSL